MSLNHFKHIYQDNDAQKTLVLLHGTGGDEHDLISLVDHLQLKANILSLRGNVLENGMNRFFRRLSPGVFDEENIREEVQKLQEFMTAFLESKNLTVKDLLYLGYSNGANMILALLLLHPEMVARATLLHPMLPLRVQPADLQHIQLAVTYGERDMMIPAAESQAVITTLREAGAQVEEFAHAGGHEVSREELDFVTQYLARL